MLQRSVAPPPFGKDFILFLVGIDKLYKVCKKFQIFGEYSQTFKIWWRIKLSILHFQSALYFAIQNKHKHNHNQFCSLNQKMPWGEFIALEYKSRYSNIKHTKLLK